MLGFGLPLRCGFGRVKERPEVVLYLFASCIIVHCLGTIADGRGDVLDVTIMPATVRAPMQIPAVLLKPNQQ